MRPQELKSALRHSLQLNRSAMIWGAPGVGKTDIINTIAKEDYDDNIIDFRMAMRDPTALLGFPVPDLKSKSMKFLRDDELPMSGKGILFMDEINSATPATMAAGMQLTLTGHIGDYKLPEGWRIVCAGNRESDRSVVNRMPSALALRLRHFDLEVHLDDWIEWAVKTDIHHSVISFIRYRPQFLHDFDPTKRSSPNPRSWEFISNDLKHNPNPPSFLAQVSGSIGEGAATEFIAYNRVVNDLVSTDEVLKNPTTASVPTSPSVLHAMSGMLGAHLNIKTVGTGLKYIERMPKEFQVLTLRDLINRDRGVQKAPEITTWVINNSDLLA